MACRKLLKLYCSYLIKCWDPFVLLKKSAQVSPLMLPAPSSPQIPQKHWDELSQPPSWKGKDLLIQNIVAAIKICGILVISSSKTLKLFGVCLMMRLSHDALVQHNNWQPAFSWRHLSAPGYLSEVFILFPSVCCASLLGDYCCVSQHKFKVVAMIIVIFSIWVKVGLEIIKIFYFCIIPFHVPHNVTW